MGITQCSNAEWKVENHRFIAVIHSKETVVAAYGAESYLPHLDRMAIPIAFVHGEENQCFLPESTLVTYNALRQINGPDLYERTVIPGYGHIDCIYGKNAAQDVYPTILEYLEKPL